MSIAQTYAMCVTDARHGNFTPGAYVVVIHNGEKTGLYGRGATPDTALRDFNLQISGAPIAWQQTMRGRAIMQPISDEEASELEEMISADAIDWL